MQEHDTAHSYLAANDSVVNPMDYCSCGASDCLLHRSGYQARPQAPQLANLAGHPHDSYVSPNTDECQPAVFSLHAAVAAIAQWL